MSADPKKVIVEENLCQSCSTQTVRVHHESFPEMRIAGMSAEQAAERLAEQLEAELDAVSNPSLREPVQRAVVDLRAFLNREGAVHVGRNL
jgi:hypothetical protein